MKKLLIPLIFALLSVGLFGAANDIALSQRNAGDTGFTQRTLPAQNALANTLASFQEGIGIGLTDTLTLAGLSTGSGSITGGAISGTTGTFSGILSTSYYAKFTNSSNYGAGAEVWTGPDNFGGLFLNAPTGQKVRLGINNSAVVLVDASGGNGPWGQTTPAAVTATKVIINGSTGQSLAVTGIANDYTASFVSGNTAGQDFGVNIQAGSNTSDIALNIISRAASPLFSVRGDGLVTALAGSFTTLVVSANSSQLTLATLTDPTNYKTVISSGYDSANPFTLTGTYNGSVADWLKVTAGGGYTSPKLTIGNQMTTVDTKSGTTTITSVSSTGLAVTGVVNQTGGSGSVWTYGGGGGGLELVNSSDTSGTRFIAFDKSTGANIGSITRVTTTDAVAFNTTSDGDRKTNIRDFTGADSGALIDALRPRWFDWKLDANDEFVTGKEADTVDTNGKVREGKPIKTKRKNLDAAHKARLEADSAQFVGFVAQEEDAANPIFARIGAVTRDAQGVARARSDTALVPILVAELQSLRARVKALEAQNASLDARLTALEKK